MRSAPAYPATAVTSLATIPPVRRFSWKYGCDICQTCCPWNLRFSKDLPHDSPDAPRAVLADKGARQLARDLWGMTPGEFSAAFRGSPMTRAKLRGLKRNAAVVLGNAGTAEDVAVLTRALDDPDPLVREHVAWALARIRVDRA